ncbi:DUF3857 domain-containing protein [Myxococcota bacterium]|nr:DUF3857 domain-containing protein [Myxococcota bacterium]
MNILSWILPLFFLAALPVKTKAQVKTTPTTMEQDAAAWWLSGTDRPMVRLCRLVELQEWLPVTWKNDRIRTFVGRLPDRQVFTQILFRLLPPETVPSLTGTQALTRFWIRHDPPVVLPANRRGEVPLAELGRSLDAPPVMSFQLRLRTARRVRVLSFKGAPGRWCVDGKVVGLARESEAGYVELDLPAGVHTVGAAWSYRPQAPALHLSVTSGVEETTPTDTAVTACPEAWPAEPAFPGEEKKRKDGFLWARFGDVSEESEAQCDLSLGRVPQLEDPGHRDLLDPHFRARVASLRGENPLPWLPGVRDKYEKTPWILYENQLILADHWYETRLGEQARLIWNRLTQAGSTGLRHRLKLIQLEAERGLVFSALLRALAMMTSAPDTPALVRSAILLSNAVPVDSVELRTRLVTLVPGEWSETLILAEVLQARGRLDEARAMLADAWKERRDFSALLAWARLTPETPVATLLAPGRHAFLNEWITAEVRAPGAASSLPAAGIPAWLAPHLPATAKLPPVAQRTDPKLAAAELLHTEQVLLLGRDGTSRYARSFLLLVRDPARAGHRAPFAVKYSPHSQAVHVLRTRVHHLDGQISSQAASVQSFDFLSGAARMYFDVRELRITFPPPAPGDIHELLYTIEDMPSTQADLGAASFGHILQMQDRWPIAAQRLRVVHPSDVPLRHAFSRPVPLKPTVTRHGDQTWIDVTGGPVPAWKPEPMAPGWGETLLTFSLGTTASWKELGLSYLRYVEPVYRPRRDMRELARKITAGSKTDLERIQAIHAWVQKNFRYVSLMFGNHGYMPYTLDEILERKFGDCKDMTLVIVHLLRGVDIAAHPAIVRTKPQGLYPMDVPSLAPFDHSIVYLPATNSWLDGTIKGQLYPIVPAWIQGRTALVVEPGGGRLVPIAQEPASASREAENVVVRVDAAGNAVAEAQFTITGQPESAWRLRLLEDNARDALSRRLRGLWPQATLTAWKTEEVESLRSPLGIRMTVALPGFFQEKPARTVEFPLSDDARLSALVTKMNRESDFVLEHAGELDRTIEVTWHRNWCASRGPQDLTLRTPHFEFTQKATLEKGKLVLTRRIALPRDRVPRADYPAFVHAVNAALLAVHSPLVITRCGR